MLRVCSRKKESGEGRLMPDLVKGSSSGIGRLPVQGGPHKVVR